MKRKYHKIVIILASICLSSCSSNQGKVVGITSKEQLMNMKNDLTAHYVLKEDIDLSDVEWTPIGDPDHPFTGSFDGNNKTIKNLTISKMTRFYGLFGYCENASFKNCHFDGTNFSMGNNPALAGFTYYIGNAVGLADNTSFENIVIDNFTSSCDRFTTPGSLYYDPEVTWTDTAKPFTGAITGLATSTCSFSNCVNNSSFSGYSYIGGLIGASYHGERKATLVLENCINNGTITNEFGRLNAEYASYEYYNYATGGLIGYTSSDVKLIDCKNNGNLIANNPLESKTADMFIGYICSNNCEIIYENCENTGQYIVIE